jgi:hypothetical protein
VALVLDAPAPQDGQLILDAPLMRDALPTLYGYFFADPSNYGTLDAVVSGGGPSVVLDAGDATHSIAAPVAFDAERVYFTVTRGGAGGTSIVSLTTYGGDLMTVATGLDTVVRLAVSAGYVYFLDQAPWIVDADSGAMTPKGLVERVAVGGGTPEVIATVPATLFGIAADSTYVYWTEWSPAGSVLRAPAAGGSVETLAAGERPGPIAVESGNVYWLNLGTMQVDCTPPDGGLVMLPAGSSTPVVLASSLKGAQAIAVRDGSVYFSAFGQFCIAATTPQGSVSKVTVATSTTVTVATGVYSPDNIYVDASTLYFTTFVPSTGALSPVTMPR